MINLPITILSRLMFLTNISKIDSRTDKLTFLNTIDFSVHNVHKILLSLKPTLSSGPDGIPNIVLRKLAH